MKINRNSWHYKIYNFFEPGAQYKHSVSLCNYFIPLIVTFLLICAFLLAFGTLFFGLVILPVFYGKWDAVIGLGIVFGAIGFFLGIFYLVQLFKQTDAGMLIRQYLKAKKDKICPIIEFTKDDSNEIEV